MMAECSGGTKSDPRAIPEGGVEAFWSAPDGHQIRRLDLAPVAATVQRGSLLFMPGRGDVYEKWVESLDHWRRQGFHVTALDWRGQGGSGRLGPDQMTGHIESFALWLEDLQAFWREWTAQNKGPYLIVGHSMGGHLVLRAVADGLIDPALTILSMPMVGVFAWGLPLWLQRALVWAMVRIGDPTRLAWRESEKPASRLAKRMQLLTHSTERYAAEMWWRAKRPFLEMGPASWGWMRAALDSVAHLASDGVLERIPTPVLLLTTARDRLVSHGANVEAVKRIPKGEVVHFGPEARHEVLREVDEVRNRALEEIDAFIDRHLPEAHDAV